MAFFKNQTVVKNNDLAYNIVRKCEYVREVTKKKMRIRRKTVLIKNASVWEVTCSREKSMIKCWNGKKILMAKQLC